MSGHSLEREARGYIRERRAIRRPQAVPYQEPTFWQQVWDLRYEVIGSLVVLGVIFFALFYALPVILTAVQ